MTLVSVYTIAIYTLGIPFMTRTYPIVATWIWFLYVSLCIINLISLILIWKWRRIGLYVISCFTIVIVLLNLLVLGEPSIDSIIIGTIGVVVLYLAMRPVWQNFK